MIGCHRSATGVFLAFGILSIVVAAIRLWMGPAQLTSWMGQHVYLSQVGVISSIEKEDLASGHLVAPTHLGKLHLHGDMVDGLHNDSETMALRSGGAD